MIVAIAATSTVSEVRVRLSYLHIVRYKDMSDPCSEFVRDQRQIVVTSSLDKLEIPKEEVYLVEDRSVANRHGLKNTASYNKRIQSDAAEPRR